MKYRPDIDGLRAIAVLAVMLYHLNGAWLPGGFTGVDIFFVISGFVVTGSLVSSSELSAGKFIAAFYARRLARIIPALVTMLVISCMLFVLFVPQAWLSFISEKTALAAFLGISNFVLQGNADTYFEPRSEYNPFTHTWSLGVEEQFYLIFPLLCLFWLRARLNRPKHTVWVITAIGLLGLGSLAGCIWATKVQPNAAFYSIAFRFWELVTGALLFQLSDRLKTAPPANSIISKFAPVLGMVLVGTSLSFANASHFPYPWALCSVIGTLMLIGRTDAYPHPVRNLLAGKLLVWFGKRSYSLYLWHWPIYVLFRWTVGIDTPETRIAAVAISLLVAAASYRYVEMPLRHNTILQKKRPILQILFFLFILFAGLLLAKNVFKHRSKISLSTVNRNVANWYPEIIHTYDDKRVCSVINQIRDFPGGKKHIYQASDCTTPISPQKLFVLGDSHATAYNPLFEQFTAEMGWSVTVYADAGCPFLDFRLPMAEKTWAPKCIDNWRAAAKDLFARVGKGDVIFLPSLRMFRFGDQWALFEHHRNVEHMEELVFGKTALEQSASARQEAIDWLKPLTDKGAIIVFEAPKPIFKSPPFRCADWFNANNPICQHGLSMQKAYLERLRAPVIESMTAVSAKLPNTFMWDPFPLLCPGETCHTFESGRPLFFDMDHVSGYANTILYPNFKHAITSRIGASSQATRESCSVK
ncbi:MAG: putative acyltransferase [Burkholderiaceae bacterium]|nr:putative acyltransferase [Burkholderiaceae bacterium]